MLTILLMAHLIADFYLQSSKMAENKDSKAWFFAVHSIIYLCVFTAVDFLFLEPITALFLTLVTAVSHSVIDLIRTKVNKKWKNYTLSFISFLIDQLLHLAVIVLAYVVFELPFRVNSIYNNFETFQIRETNIGFAKIISYGLLLLIILKPTSILIKKTFEFLFKENSTSELENHAGEMIGMLERTITAILLLCNQFAAVGLVITAKSIARFKQMENKEFAERYLIGTLLSLSVPMILTIVFKSIFLL